MQQMPADLLEQRNDVLIGLIREKVKGDVWYLIALPWYQLWSRYVGVTDECVPGLEANYPGPIDNSSIVDSNGLLPGVTERNFMAVPACCWEQLAKYYAICAKAPIPLARWVVLDSNKNPTIELFPFSLVVCYLNEDGSMHFLTQLFSRSATIEHVVEKVSSGRSWIGALTSSLTQKYINFWLKRKDSNKIEQQNGKLGVTLEELNLVDGSLLIFKRSTEKYAANLNAYKPIFEALGFEISNQAAPSPASTQKQGDENIGVPAKTRGTKPGLCGLDNLGNTCFMNSVIQCLSNVAEFRDFFISSNYKTAVDRAAKRGELADCYAALMRSIWSGFNETATPRDFRDAFLQRAADFSQGQQDACSFLDSLLQCMREELSKSEKPLTLENELLPTEKEAAEHWLQYKGKQASLVSDLFDGHLRSTLRCEVCKDIARNYEPFTCLSLPIPSWHPMTIYFRFCDPKKRVSIVELMAPRRCRVGKIRALAAEAFDRDPGKFVIAGMTMGEFRFTKWYTDDEIATFSDREVVLCFETEKLTYELEKCVRIVVYIGSGTDTLRGFPHLLAVSRGNTTEMGLNQLVYQLVEPLFSYHGDIPIEGQHYCLMLANVDLSGDKVRLTGSGNFVFRNDIAAAKTKCLVMLWNSRDFKQFFKESSFEAALFVDRQEPPDVTLNECFTLLLDEERLSGRDAWRCPKCKNEPQPAWKKIDLTLLPSYFILHLNRFHQDDWGFSKLETCVTYPLKNLEMTAFAPNLPNSTNSYDLMAVVNHYGDINGGHYKALALNSDLQRWYQFDDRDVSELATEKVVTEAAFLLFYKRRQFPKESVV